MDVSGEQQIDVDHNVFKQRLRLDGTPFPELPEKEDFGAAVKNVRLAIIQGSHLDWKNGKALSSHGKVRENRTKY